MEVVEYQIHWLSLTVKEDWKTGFDLYNNIFRDRFGPLVFLGNGGRGFKEIHHSLLEIKLYCIPNNENSVYFHLEIPGQACEAMTEEYYFELYRYLESNFHEEYLFKRLDFAFDNVNFTPKQLSNAIIEERTRTLAKRETFTIRESPYKKKDDGTLGTYTAELGSNTSERMITCYNKRGYTRLEFQTRDKRADSVARALFQVDNSEKWFNIAASHLRDYIDFNTSWWTEFVNCQSRANLKISDPRNVSLENLYEWLYRQVACGLSVITDALPPEAIEMLIKSGRIRRGGRYELLLRNYMSEKSRRNDE